MGKIIVLDSEAGVQFPKLIAIFYYAIRILSFNKNLTFYTVTSYWNNCTLPQGSLCIVKVKVKLSHYRPGVAQRVPGN